MICARRTRKLARLINAFYANDQRDRLDGRSKVSLAQRDSVRQEFAWLLLRQRQDVSARTAFALAMIMHHGGSLKELYAAKMFVAAAVAKNHPKAPWLAATIHDRLCILRRKPQYYGTQFVRDQSSGAWRLYPLDGRCSEAEREKLGLNTLVEIREMLAATG